MAAVSLNDALKFEDKDAANQMLRDEAMNKDFWAVNDYQDNCEKLQALIDLLFNTEEGNDYIVDYQDNQSGTRLIIVCKVCSKELTSYDPFIAHENGKPHKKVRHKALSSQEASLEGLELQPHNKPRRIFPDGSLEDQIDSTRLHVLGMQFVYKEVIDGRETFTCQLCLTNSDVRRLSSSRMFSHLTSKGHNKAYLDTKFGYCKKQYKELEDEFMAIEEYEGKIHTNIVDLTKDLPQSKSREEPQSLPLSSPKRESSLKTELPEIKCEVQTSSKPKPDLYDVGVNVDMSSDPRFILNEISVLQDIDCLMILQDDDDMQDLLKETLWELANKMEKYYTRTKATYTEKANNFPLTVAAEKVKQYVLDLVDID